jgi:hypothetical protein
MPPISLSYDGRSTFRSELESDKHEVVLRIDSITTYAAGIPLPLFDRPRGKRLMVEYDPENVPGEWVVVTIEEAGYFVCIREGMDACDREVFRALTEYTTLPDLLRHYHHGKADMVIRRDGETFATWDSGARSWKLTERGDWILKHGDASAAPASAHRPDDHGARNL